MHSILFKRENIKTYAIALMLSFVFMPVMADELLKHNFQNNPQKEVNKTPLVNGSFKPLPSKALVVKGKAGNVCSNPCANIGNFDTRNCHVFSAPVGSEAFIYSNNFYVTPVNGVSNNCPSGSSWDSENCFVGNIPNGRNSFVYDNKLYLTRVCDPIDWPNKTIQFEALKIEKQKDYGLAGKDDVSFIAVSHAKNSCDDKQTYQKLDFLNVGKKKIGTWINHNMSITGNNSLKPNQVLELLLFDQDKCGANCNKEFVTSCDTLAYKARDTAYGG